LKINPAGTPGEQIRSGILLTGIIAAVLAGPTLASGQQSTSSVNGQQTQALGKPESGPVADFLGATILRIDFVGADPARFTPLPEGLAKLIGTPLTQESLSRSLRQVFATGLFETVEVQALREPKGIVLIFNGAPRLFVGTVSVVGAKGATINTQLERATRLQAGTRFTEARLNQGIDQMRQALLDNGFHPTPKRTTRRYRL